MRFVHLADVHLGYRQYTRCNPSTGLNQREEDVYEAFGRALVKIRELEPDLVLIAGDLFHLVRPSPRTLERAFQGLQGLQKRCPVPFVFIAGNHESPRYLETGSVLRLLPMFLHYSPVYVAWRNIETFHLSDLQVSVTCIPYACLLDLAGRQVTLTPDPKARYNLLMVHGTLEGIPYSLDGFDQLRISRSQILGDGWDYVALGHYHIYTQVASNAFYSGSLEFTSCDIWTEARKHSSKGFIEYDLDHLRHTFHSIPTRQVIHLKRIRARDRMIQEINKAIREQVESIKGGIKDKIVRLDVDEFDLSLKRELDWSQIREYKNQALHFELKLNPHRSEERTEETSLEVFTLEDAWKQYAESYSLPGDISREAFINKGLEYLQMSKKQDL